MFIVIPSSRKSILIAAIQLIFWNFAVYAPLKAQTPELTAEEYNIKAAKLLNKEPSKSLEYSFQALKISKKLNNRQQLATCYKNIGLSYHSLGLFNNALDYLKKARDEYNKAGMASYEAEILIYTANSYKDLGKYEKAVTILDESLKLYNNLKDSSGLANVYRSFGSLEWKQNQFRKALQSYGLAYSIASRNNAQPIAAQSLNGIGVSYSEMRAYDSSFIFYQKSLKINTELKDSIRMGELYNLLGSLFQRSGRVQYSLGFYDTACSIFLQAGYRREYARALRNKGLAYKELKLPDEAIIPYEQALAIYLELHDTAEIARSLIQTASLKITVNKFTEAHKNLLTAIQLCIQANKKSEIIEAYNSLGLIYFLNEYYLAALTAHVKSVNYAREIGDKNKLKYALTLEGNDLISLNRPEDAVLAFRESYDLSAGMSDVREQASAGRSLARAQIAAHNFESAERLLNKSLADFEKLDYRPGILQTMNELGNLYEVSHQNAKSIKIYNEIISRARNWNDLYYISLCNRKAADILLKEKKLESAKSYLNEALESALKSTNKELIKNTWHSLANYYELSGDFRNSLKFLHLYSDLSDSIENSQQAEILLQKQASFDVNLKDNELNRMEQQVELLEKEQEIRNLELNKKNIQRNFAILIVILMFLMVFLLWKRYQFRIKKEAELSRAMEVLRHTNIKLEESEKELQNLNASKDKFFSIIAHDIKNPLSGILGFGEHLVRNYKTLEEEEIHEIAVIINDASHNLYALLENLLSWSRLQTGKMNYMPTEFDIKQVSLQSIELQKLNAGSKKIILKTEMEDGLLVKADINMFKLVVRNLLSNAVKFSHPGGTIALRAKKSEARAIVSVKDSGVGMSEEQLSKIFLVDSNLSTRGTSNEEGTGLGLLLCKECVEKNGGSMSVESKPGLGTIFSFTVPLKF